jgi:light-regulated signal transduction histidine kinase (bacteriophytochrome)
MKAIGGQVAAALIRMQGELSLRRTAEELARSNRALEQFAYVSSHDLREPLRTVTGFVQILEDRYRDQLDARAHEYIGFAVDGARRMQQLIDNLLAYARVGSALSIQPGNARDALDRALDALKGMVGESGAVITTDPMPVVPADATLLCQVFQNLVENAIKFRSADPLRIHVGARRERGGWLFRVTDNGIGMEREHGERIFVIFKRLHSREKCPGTGIGLALCKKIVERHGGRIWVESEPGRGSTFYFTLPDRTE